MIDYSNPTLLALRRVGQKLGVLRPIVRMVRKIFNLSYESRFDLEMMKEVTENDIVWDIGANVGYFTKKFAEKVGKGGRVYAFEPAQSSYLSLIETCAGYENVFAKNLAVSNQSGDLYFRDSGIDNDPTNGLVDEMSPNTTRVTAVRADEFVQTKPASMPNVIKIDVEGFEFEVINGMKEMLKNPSLKKVFMEVHFLELNKRGLKAAPSDIVSMLTDSGFSVTWTDPSHFIASR